MTTSHDIGCIILAAGLSSRMGSPKALLPWGDSTLIQQVIGLVKAADIPHIFVVTGNAAAVITPLVMATGVQAVFNNDYAKGEITSSLKVGLRALPDTCMAALVMLSDQPLIQPQTIRQIIDTWRESHPAAITPTYEAQRGHPVLFSRRLWPDILALPADELPRAVLRQHAQHVTNLPVDDAGILVDLDTPDEYQRAYHANH